MTEASTKEVSVLVSWWRGLSRPQEGASIDSFASHRYRTLLPWRIWSAAERQLHSSRDAGPGTDRPL